MLTKSKITKILDLFFAFNHVENSDSLMIELSDYNDEFFRWRNDTFKHDKYLTGIVNENGIFLFSTQKLRERLSANREKIKKCPKEINFGCPYDIVKDLILKIPIQSLSNEELLEIDIRMSEMKEEQKRATERLLEKEKQQK